MILCTSRPRILGILVLDFTCISKIVLSCFATISAGPLLPFEKKTSQPLFERHNPAIYSASLPNLLQDKTRTFLSNNI